MHKKPCARNCSRKREGLYNGNAQQNPLCAASCVTKDIHISPRFSPAFFYRDVNSVVLLVLRGLSRICTIKLTRIVLEVSCCKCWKWWVSWALDKPFSLIRTAPIVADELNFKG